MLSRLYNKAIAYAEHKKAAYWLACLSFIEAIFFPLPPDILLVGMVLSARSKWLRYALIAACFSVLGGIFAYYIGVVFIDLVAEYINYFGYTNSYLQVKLWFQAWGFWAVFIAGFTPVPYKIFTLAAGSFQMSLMDFCIASFISRCLRFALVAYIAQRIGSKINLIGTKYIDPIGWGIILFTIVYYMLFA